MSSSKAFMAIGRSFLYVRKCKGPRIYPWGTLYITVLSFKSSDLL